MMLNCSISFQSIPRVLKFFKQNAVLDLNWIPHFTSVINWSLRIGLGLLKKVKPTDQSWIAIIDHSIDIGTKKALVVLRVNTDIIKRKGKAIQLEDCECVGLKVAEVVNGESIALELEEIFLQSGNPSAILKDCDSTLQKGVRLYCNKQKIMIPVIEDLGHVTANALKSQYANSEGYKSFTKLSADGASRLRQTNLAFLTPPKLRSKGRFQNVGKLGLWGKKILTVLEVKGRAKKDSMLDRLRKALPGFIQHKGFIKGFAKTAIITAEIMKLLKNKGLNENTYKESVDLAKKLPPGSKVKKRLMTWLEKHIAIQEEIQADSLLISSDIIESLFGKFKQVIERSSHADMNRTVLLIPTFCGSHDKSELNEIFSKTRHKDLKHWEEDNIPYTLRKMRQSFFDTKTSQILGN